MDSMTVNGTSQHNDGTSPRILVRFTLYRPHSDEVDHYAWEAMQPQGVIDDGTGFERDVIGFAEFPRDHAVGRFTKLERFADHVESNAVYYHWKPSERPPSVDSE